MKDSKVLLGLRKNTCDFSGYWSLPVGHVEPGESLLDAIKRELFEELAIEGVKAHPICVKTDESKSIYHQVFNIESWKGEATNLEPDLCSELKWFSLDELPQNLTPISKEILAEL